MGASPDIFLLLFAMLFFLILGFILIFHPEQKRGRLRSAEDKRNARKKEDQESSKKAA